MYKKNASSIASRLTTSYILLTLITNLIFISVVYYGTKQLIYEQNWQFLTGELNTIHNIIKTSKNPNIRNSNLNQEIILEPQTSKYHYFVRISDEYGKIQIQTPNIPTTIPKPSPQRIDTKPLYSLITQDQGKKRQYAIMTTIHHLLGTKITIQIGLDYTRLYNITTHYRNILWTILLSNILVSLIICSLLTKKGLTPLNQLNNTLSRLDIDQLNYRLTFQHWPKELQETAKRLNALLTRIEEGFTRLQQFSTDLAHEIRTPINAIRCQIEVCLHKDRTKTEYLQTLTGVLQEHHHITTLSDDILFIAKSKDPHYKMEQNIIALHTLFQELTEYLNLFAQEKAITFQYTGKATVIGDKNLLKRAFSNILVNSIKYSDPQKTIVITIERQKKQATITIKDQGIGIPETAIQHVFERFYRIDQSRSRKTGGTGLGLHITQSIINLHGGKITLTSALKKGTTILVTLPIS